MKYFLITFKNKSALLVRNITLLPHSLIFLRKKPWNIDKVSLLNDDELSLFFPTLTTVLKKVKNFEFIYIAVPGPYQKAIVKSNNALYKVPMTLKANKMIKNEIYNLYLLYNHKDLRNFLPIIQKVINLESIIIIKFYLIRNNFFSFNYFNRKFKNYPALFLYKKDRIFLKRNSLENTNTYKIIINSYKEVTKNISNNTKQILDKALLHLNNLKEQKIYTTFAHRDFTKWNILTTNKGIKVIDWEYAIEDYNLLYDCIHYNFISMALKNKNIEFIYKAIKNNIKQYLNILKIHTTEININLEVILYLTDLILFYLNSQNGKNEKDFLIQRYLYYLDYFMEKEK